jgi:hypothetical protein
MHGRYLLLRTVRAHAGSWLARHSAAAADEAAGTAAAARCLWFRAWPARASEGGGVASLRDSRGRSVARAVELPLR